MNPFLPDHAPTDETIHRWWNASRIAAIDGAFLALHDHAATVTTLHRPVCLASGKCCHFQEHGHLLAVTGLEAMWVWRKERTTGSRDAVRRAMHGGRCVYLSGTLCSIHENRPSGCRSYFCDRGDGAWQSILSESIHRAIRAIHDEHEVPYLCAEWTWLLNALADADARGVLSSASPP
ncbi:MAG: YkgJ family cysteine cluster protein [Phycisphaerales bacterium]|nr:YkgJ family cysteine cluster protein [Phycisphaerales bacterium]